MRERMGTYDLIRSAAVNLDSISARFEGHVRLFSPHVLGTKKGESRVLGYQFGGTSHRGLGPQGSLMNWRCFPIDKLTDVALIAGTWRSPSRFGTDHEHCIDEVDVSARISPDRDQCDLDEAA